MAVESLHDLFIEELRDTYDAEKRIVKALPKMAKAASDSDLRTAFTNHLRETERQVARLEQVFKTVSEKPRGKKCDGMMGILEEGEKAIEELEEGPVLDAALIAGAQKVEHYEIASYGTLAYFAELLGNNRAKELLGATLDEEKAADEKLNEIAESDVNRRALTEGGDAEQEGDWEEGTAFATSGAGRRKSAAAMSRANERARGSSGSRRRSGGRASRSGRR